MFEKYLNKDELIKNLQELIKIPSVHSESNNVNEPFGENTIKALEYTLNLGKKLGFKTKNIDGYCGYIEFGEGPELIGIVGHLDVVPEGENWTYPPFDARIEDNKMYGRGAIDDKGPVMASLYAMKAVMDYCSENNISINKRVRLILGLNEERDWKCINYYKGHEEIPSIGFSPDADFPCIYAEKGLLSPFLIMDYSNFKDKDIILSDINCNNNPLNVVPKYCSCTISVKNNIDIDDVISFVRSVINEPSFKIDIEILNNNISEIEGRYMKGAKMYKTWGSYAPAFGMIGTLVGLIQMLAELDNPDNIASGMAAALITTFYGALLANLILNPLGFNLENKGQREVENREMMLIGILSIKNGDSTRVLEEKLKSFLNEKEKVKYEKESSKDS